MKLWAPSLLMLSASLFCAAYILGCASRSSSAAKVGTTQVLAGQQTEHKESPAVSVEGEWELVWKGCNQQLERVLMTIEQKETTLKVRLAGGTCSRFDGHLWVAGTAGVRQFSFKIPVRHAKPMVFTGTLQNGILCGSTDTGAQWMALRHFD